MQLRVLQLESASRLSHTFRYPFTVLEKVKAIQIIASEVRPCLLYPVVSPLVWDSLLVAWWRVVFNSGRNGIR
jgi:hypothetical protein